MADISQIYERIGHLISEFENTTQEMTKIMTTMKEHTASKLKLSEFQAIIDRALRDLNAINESMIDFKEERIRVDIRSYIDDVVSELPMRMIELEPRLIECSNYPLFTIRRSYSVDTLIINTHAMYKNMVPIELQESCEVTKFNLYGG